MADTDLHDLVAYFEDSESATDESRRLSERDIDYYDGKQFTDDEIATLKKNKQPVVTYNRIQRKIDFLSGLERQSRKDPKAYPRNPGDDEAADAATDAIRYVCDAAGWDDKRSAVWDDILKPGTGAVFVGVEEVKGGFDPSITCIAWDRLFYDPRSCKPDFSDARYMGIVTWYDMEDARTKWPDAADVLEASLADAADTTYEDKPRFKVWGESKAKRVRVCEIYYRRKGEWMRAVYTKMGFVEEPTQSPYLDEDGQPECPIKAVSLYVDRDNNRYGAVRMMIGPQDEVNKRRGKGLHLISVRQSRVGIAAGLRPRDVQKQLSDPQGVIVADQGDFEILETNDMAAANFQLLQEAKNEIDLLGANAALAGKNEQAQSGRALLAQQQGGMVEVARAFDRLRMLSLDVYHAIWNRIRQVWTEERWIRVTDNERNVRFVGINQRVTVGMVAQGVTEGNPRDIEAAVRIVGPQIMQAYMQGDQRAQMVLGAFVQQNRDQVVEVRNAINEVDIDIVIDEGMDSPTIQAEQFEMLAKMLPAFGEKASDPRLLEMLIEASMLRDKDKLVEIIKPQGPQQSPEQLMEAQKQAALQQAEMEGQIEIEKARIKAATEIEIARIKDATDREIAGARIENEHAADMMEHASAVLAA